jgi:hypothetical protein
MAKNYPSMYIKVADFDRDQAAISTNLDAMKVFIQMEMYESSRKDLKEMRDMLDISKKDPSKFVSLPGEVANLSAIQLHLDYLMNQDFPLADGDKTGLMGKAKAKYEEIQKMLSEYADFNYQRAHEAARSSAGKSTEANDKGWEANALILKNMQGAKSMAMAERQEADDLINEVYGVIVNDKDTKDQVNRFYKEGFDSWADVNALMNSDYLKATSTFEDAQTGFQKAALAVKIWKESHKDAVIAYNKT